VSCNTVAEALGCAVEETNYFISANGGFKSHKEITGDFYTRLIRKLRECKSDVNSYGLDVDCISLTVKDGAIRHVDFIKHKWRLHDFNHTSIIGELKQAEKNINYAAAQLITFKRSVDYLIDQVRHFKTK